MAKPTRHYGAWRIRWIDEHERRRSEVYPSFHDAEVGLRRRQAEADEIRLGIRTGTPVDRSFGELCDHYLRIYSSQKRRQRDDESIIRVHLRPYFGQLNIREVGGHVESFKAARAHLNRKTLHNQLTLLISMLKAAHEIGWLSEAPRIRKPRIRLFDKDFRYLRTKEEIERFLRSAQVDGDLVYSLYSFAVFTGMREGELAGLFWSDINFERRLIAVQRSYDGPTKAGDVRYVPILDPLLPILRVWRLKCPGEIVFPNRAGRMQRDSNMVFQEVLHRVLERAGFKKVVRSGKLRYPIVFHDLRHTFASHWMMNGGDLFRLQKILGHKDPQMTMRYSHLAPDAFSSDYARLGSVPPAQDATILRLPSHPGP